MGNAAAFVSLALFVVWMQRRGRWGLFFKSITGQTEIAGSRLGSQQGGMVGSAPLTPAGGGPVATANPPGNATTLIPGAPVSGSPTPPVNPGGQFV